MAGKRRIRKLLRGMASITTAGVLLQASCGSSDIRAVLAGVDAATRELENQDQITLAEFILSQLGD